MPLSYGKFQHDLTHSSACIAKKNSGEGGRIDPHARARGNSNQRTHWQRALKELSNAVFCGAVALLVPELCTDW